MRGASLKMHGAGQAAKHADLHVVCQDTHIDITWHVSAVPGGTRATDWRKLKIFMPLPPPFGMRAVTVSAVIDDV